MYHIYEGSADLMEIISADLMEIIFPRGKDTICNAFNRSVEKAKVPSIKQYDILVVYYDEQHPKAGPRNSD
jgi:hypothetical protein